MQKILPDLVPRDEVEGIIERRLQEQAAVVKAAGIDKTLKSLRLAINRLDRRVQDANHLKQTFVTKEEFKEFRDEFTDFSDSIRDKLSNVVSVEALGDGDFWVKHGIPTDFTQDELEFARRQLKMSMAQDAVKKQTAKWHNNLWVRVGIVAAVLGSVFMGIQSYLVWFVYAHSTVNSAPR